MIIDPISEIVENKPIDRQPTGIFVIQVLNSGSFPTIKSANKNFKIKKTCLSSIETVAFVFIVDLFRYFEKFSFAQYPVGTELNETRFSRPKSLCTTETLKEEIRALAKGN